MYSIFSPNPRKTRRGSLSTGQGLKCWVAVSSLSNRALRLSGTDVVPGSAINAQMYGKPSVLVFTAQ